MSIIGGFKAMWQGWEKIDDPPKWVWKSYDRWGRKSRTHPYNKTKHFGGKNYTYRVRHGMGGQGEAPIIGWYRQRKKR